MNTEWSVELYQLHKAEVQRRAIEAAKPRNFLEKIVRGVEVSGNFLATADAVKVLEGHPILPDVSVWQPKIDYAFLKKQGMAGLICKMGEIEYDTNPDTWHDKLFATHVQGAYDQGLPYAGYWYLNPMWGLAAQYGLDRFKVLERKHNLEYQALRTVLINKARPGFIALDLERWYTSTPKYFQMLRGEIPQSAVGVISPNWILADLELMIRHLQEGMKAGEIPMTNIVIYTGDWFTRSYMVVDRINTFYNKAPFWESAGISLWVARYPWYGLSIGWEQIRSTYFPNGTTQKPDYCNFKSVFLWQYMVASLPMPGTLTGRITLDINVSMLPSAAFNDFMGVTSTTPPPPPPPPPADTGGTDMTEIEGRLTAQEARIKALEAFRDHITGYKA